MNILEWLSAQELYPKVFWQSREGNIRRASIGASCFFSELPQFQPNDPQNRCYYGGMRFSREKKSLIWDGFPDRLFWTPYYEIIERNGQQQFIEHTPAQLLPPTPLFQTSIYLKDQEESVAFPIWCEQFEKLKQKMAQTNTHKVVMGRNKRLYFREKISVWERIRSLQARTQNATIFAFEMQPGLSFFGATPEKLFSRKKNAFLSEAVAGTRPRGKTEQEDRLLQEELLQDPKEKKEFLYVKDFIHATLSPLCDSIRWGEDRTIKTTRIQHLYNQLHGNLKSTISDLDLILALHPTPALGGAPRKNALELILELESFDRGWYGSPIGWSTPDEAEFAVAIRSGLIRDNRMDLFAAAGILPMSNAEKEWKEIELKLNSIIDASLSTVTSK